MSAPDELFPHLRAAESSPPVPEAPGAIVLACERPRLTPSGPSWPLRGSFHLRHTRPVPVDVLRGLVVTLTSGDSLVTRARHALGDALLFSEDVQAQEGLCRGHFNLDLADLFELENRHESFHVSVSIGSQASAVLTRTLEFPWIPAPVAGAAPEPEGRSAEPDEDEEPPPDDGSWQVDD